MVVLTVTWKPRATAAFIPAMAASYAPSRSTMMSWTSRGPSMCTLRSSLAEGWSLSRVCASRVPLVHRYTHRFIATSPAAISPICGWISGSPPHTDTTGAPHSRLASRHSSTLIRSRVRSLYSRMRPQPAQVRLHANSGSSISTSGTNRSPASFLRTIYDASELSDR